MNIFAIIVTYNGMKWLDRCLGSLEASEIPVSIVVIDNASTDGTPDYIAEKFPNVHLIRSYVNYGFAKANNIGIRYALDNGADYFLLLNQDAWLNGSDTIGKMVQTLNNNPKAGIVCPVNMNGRNNAMEEEYATDMPGEFVSDMFVKNVKASYQVKYINAAVWLLNSSCIRTVGGFDTSMFVHYGEDNNYCQRVIYHGFDILIDTTCTACHDTESRTISKKEYRNRSFKQDDISRRIEWCNLLYDIDIDSAINCTMHSIMRMRHTMRFKKAKKYTDELEFYRKVKASREMNKQKGLTWL